MKLLVRRIYILLFGLLLVLPAFAQQRITISGTITDASTGEHLIGVSIYFPNLKSGTYTNEYGYYSITVPQGKEEMEISFIGYKTEKVTVNGYQNQRLNVQIHIEASDLQAVIVTSERQNLNVTRSETSVERLTSSKIKTIPAMMGEVDVIKAIQLLPGVQPVSEGSSSFSVRGGGYDQNLILLDEATVYSASHLLGFFSVFNNDAIKDVKLYKGDIPATFGGRLSSLMDVRSKDGNNKRFLATGGIGTIASRLTLEGPLFTDKVSFLVSGRRTYADLFLLAANDASLRKTDLYFYDLNAKLNYRINDNNRIFIAGYFGRDYFSMPIAMMGFGNRTATLRWNHIFTPKLFSNFSLLVSHYDYHLSSSITEDLAQKWDSKLKDYSAKMDFSYNINPKNALKFGYHIIHHTIEPGKGGGTSTGTIIQNYDLNPLYGLEQALYVSNETTLWEKLTLRYGLRYAFYHNLGNGYEVIYMDDYAVQSTSVIAKGKIYHTNHGLEPRLGAAYVIDDKQSVKASYSRSAQYIQLASNSAAGSPLDLWFPASPNVKPQLCDQFVIGYFRNFNDNMFETSVELYYKDFKNVVDFKERPNIFGNQHLDTELRFGRGYSYGAELMIRKNSGKINGWVSYTYSRSFRQVDQINNNEWYNSPFDKPHYISVVLNYDFAKKWSASASWVYATGTPVTYPEGRYWIEGKYIPIPSKRNAYRFPDFHRLDLSVTWKLSDPKKKFQSDLNFSIYNAYGRKNPWTIYFKQEEDNPDKTYAEMIYLFSFVPSITWNFTF